MVGLSIGGAVRWYPVGLVLAYLMHVYLETGVHPAAAARSIVVVLVVAVLVQIVLTRILRDRELGALATAALLVLVAGAHPRSGSRSSSRSWSSSRSSSGGCSDAAGR